MEKQGDRDVNYVSHILNIIDVGIHLVDQEGVTVFYNHKMAEIDGLPGEDVLGKKYSTFTLP